MPEEDGVPQPIVTPSGDYEQNAPQDYATSVCFLFAQLDTRGVSILFLSGDDGFGEGDCTVSVSSSAPCPLHPVRVAFF